MNASEISLANETHREKSLSIQYRLRNREKNSLAQNIRAATARPKLPFKVPIGAKDAAATIFTDTLKSGRQNYCTKRKEKNHDEFQRI